MLISLSVGAAAKLGCRNTRPRRRTLLHAGTMVITNAAGHIRTYDRPKEGAGSDEASTTTASASNA